VLGNGVYQSFFDLHGGYFDDPGILREIALLNRVLADAVKYDRTSVAEILVVSDERSCDYAVGRSRLLAHTLRAAQTQLAKIGAPHDSVLLEDLPRLDLAPYKLVVFLNPYHLSEAGRRELRERLLGQDRWVVWCYAAGLFCHNRRDEAAMRELTGIDLAWDSATSLVAPQVHLSLGAGALSESLRSVSNRHFGPSERCCELLYVQDDRATRLGIHPNSGRTVFASKALARWTSVYCLTSQIPAEILRCLAKCAGVHIYNDANDTLYGCRSYLTLNADGAGLRTIRLRTPCHVWDPFSNTRLLENACELHRELQDKETLLVRLQAVGV
jgi:hypothetical protein